MTMRALMAAALCLAACNGKPSPDSVAASAEPAPVLVATATAEEVKVPDVLELEGTLAANRKASLSPLVAGHVSAVAVELGDVVDKGAPLIVLRATSLRLSASAAQARARAQREQLGLDPRERFDVMAVPSVVAAKSERDLAADNLRRLTPLEATGAIDARSFEQAKASAEAAEARYVAARNQAVSGYASYRALSADAAARAEDLQNTTVTAPFAGAVVRRMVEVGEYVSPQQPVVELVDASRLRLELDVPERSAHEVSVGQPVGIRIDGSDATLRGEVRFVAAAIDAQRRTLSIEVLADNPGSKIRAGHFARARIELGTARSLVRVPQTAVQERAGVYRLYVVEDGRVRARIVELVERREDGALVRGEVTGGTTVVAEPSAEVADGVAVRSQ